MLVAAMMLGAALSPGAFAQQDADPDAFDDDNGSVHEPALNTLAELGIIDGTECAEGQVCHTEAISRETAAVWLTRAASPEQPRSASAVRFADVDPQSAWAANIERLAELGVTLGCLQSPLSFCPTDTVTRGQMASFLVRAFDIPDASSPAGFTDTAGSTHAAAIDALAEAGVTVGCRHAPLQYCPIQNVTRGHMATFLVRAMSMNAGGGADPGAGGTDPAGTNPQGGGAEAPEPTTTTTTTTPDNEDPVVLKSTVTVRGSAGVSEGGNVVFTVTANPRPESDLSVQLTVSQAGDHATGGIGTRAVWISKGQSTARVVIPTQDDGIDEPDGTITATLSKGSSYTVGSPSSARVAVADNDTAAGDDDDGTGGGSDDTGTDDDDDTNDDDDDTGGRGNTGTDDDSDDDGDGGGDPPVVKSSVTLHNNARHTITEGKTATFKVTATPAPSTSLSVRITVGQTGSVAGAGQLGTRTVTFSPGSSSTTLSVSTVDDSTDEIDGRITATLLGGDDYTVGVPASTSVVITDDDDPPPAAKSTLSISASRTSVTEGAHIKFNITANPAPSVATRVEFNVTDSGEFVAFNQDGPRVIILSKGAGSGTLTVITINDDKYEPNGTISATIKPSSAYTIGSGSASTSIADNDPKPAKPVVRVSSGTGSITEGGTATFTISASPSPGSSLTVSYFIEDKGGVTSGGGGLGSVTISAGGSSATVSVSTVDDSIDQEADDAPRPSRHVALLIQAGSGYDRHVVLAARVYVRDDD